ncbi:hypothetical protein K438DRAFT_1551732, partial [Mycena galopus ATCC 62051]
PAWAAAVEAWHALEEATGFQTAGQALPTAGRPDAVGWWVQRARNDRRMPCRLDDKDKENEREDFYEQVVSWWISLNPAWRKEGLAVAADFDFKKHGLKQISGGDLTGLFPGLNGMTSVLACLWWWYHLAGMPEGAAAWRALLADVTWVLRE